MTTRLGNRSGAPARLVTSDAHLRTVALAALAALLLWPALVRAQIPVGTRVGTAVATSGYEDGGRRDPFVSLITPKKPLLPATRVADRSGSGLSTVAIADVKVTGTTKVGKKYRAIIESTDRRSYTVSEGDRLLDGVVKSIDADGVVFTEQAADITGAPRAHEVRRSLRPNTAEGVR
jgi:Tfp pilus assembly protein PilP